MRYSENGRPIINIYWWYDSLCINGVLYMYYSKREALKRYRERYGLKNKKCVVIDSTTSKTR